MWLRHECETGRRDVRRSYVSSKMHGAAGRHLPSLTMRGHCGCVNALEFSKNDGGQWIVSGGDDTRVLVWNANRIAAGVVEANSLKTRHASNIFTVQFDNESRCVYSGGKSLCDVIYAMMSRSHRKRCHGVVSRSRKVARHVIKIIN